MISAKRRKYKRRGTKKKTPNIVPTCSMERKDAFLLVNPQEKVMGKMPGKIIRIRSGNILSSLAGQNEWMW
jgi:hypothetical protein